MKVIQEGEITVQFPDSVKAKKFDDAAQHGLTHCMKAVDFIVETSTSILFIEFKDPDDSAALAANRAAYLGKFLSGKIDQDLKTKFRDSFLYEWGLDSVKKPIHYLVLIGASGLSAAELLARTDSLKRLIPIRGPKNTAWKNPMAASCKVMNIKAWNKALPAFLAARV